MPIWALAFAVCFITCRVGVVFAKLLQPSRQLRQNRQMQITALWFPVLRRCHRERDVDFAFFVPDCRRFPRAGFAIEQHHLFGLIGTRRIGDEHKLAVLRIGPVFRQQQAARKRGRERIARIGASDDLAAADHQFKNRWAVFQDRFDKDVVAQRRPIGMRKLRQFVSWQTAEQKLSAALRQIINPQPKLRVLTAFIGEKGQLRPVGENVDRDTAGHRHRAAARVAVPSRQQPDFTSGADLPAIGDAAVLCDGASSERGSGQNARHPSFAIGQSQCDSLPLPSACSKTACREKSSAFDGEAVLLSVAASCAAQGRGGCQGLVESSLCPLHPQSTGLPQNRGRWRHGISRAAERKPPSSPVTEASHPGRRTDWRGCGIRYGTTAINSHGYVSHRNQQPDILRAV